jgi:hypothetical protein
MTRRDPSRRARGQAQKDRDLSGTKGRATHAGRNAGGEQRRQPGVVRRSSGPQLLHGDGLSKIATHPARFVSVGYGSDHRGTGKRRAPMAKAVASDAILGSEHEREAGQLGAG